MQFMSWDPQPSKITLLYYWLKVVTRITGFRLITKYTSSLYIITEFLFTLLTYSLYSLLKLSSLYVSWVAAP